MESPLRDTRPPVAKSYNEINLKQQRMVIASVAAPGYKDVLQSPLWSHWSATKQAARSLEHSSHSVPGAVCYSHKKDMWWLSSHASAGGGGADRHR